MESVRVYIICIHVKGKLWIRLDTGQEDTDRETLRHVGGLGHCALSSWGTGILGLTGA